MSSPTGPAEHCAGGSRAKSLSSLLIRFSAIVCAFRRASHYPDVYSKVRPKLLIIPAAGKDSLFFSHRLCQTQAPPRIRPPTPPSRAQGELRVEGERFASLVQAEWTRHPLAVSLSEQHLLTKRIGGRTGRAGDGGGSWAEGEGRRVAETLRLREASRTGRRP